MRPWNPSSEIIECFDTVLGDVDLHNECDFKKVVASIADDGLTISLHFAKIGGALGEEFALRFTGVRELALSSREAEVPDDRNVFHALDYVESENADSEFLIETEMLGISFRCQRVQFEMVAGQIITELC